jgi:hydroxyacylglutathione hydrolase
VFRPKITGKKSIYMQILTYSGLSTAKTYLVKTTGGYILIDPGFPSCVKDVLKEHSHILLIVLTHRHYDHHGAAGMAAGITKAKIAALPKNNHKMMEIPRFRSFFVRIFYSWFRSGFSLPKWEDRKIEFNPVPADIILKDRDYIDPEKKWQVLAAPGHTSDSLCLYHCKSGILFSGDTLVNSFGKPGWSGIITDPEAFIGTRKKLSRLHIRIIYPGHGDKFIIDEGLRDKLFSGPV